MGKIHLTRWVDEKMSRKGSNITKQKGRNYNIPFNNNSECQWSQLSNQKTQTRGLDLKKDPNICCLQEMHLTEEKHKLKVKGGKKVFQTNGYQK
jgi:hypothetical protein